MLGFVCPIVVQYNNAAYARDLEHPAFLLFQVISPYVYAVGGELKRFNKSVVHFLGISGLI